jgi:hypothetical protein
MMKFHPDKCQVLAITKKKTPIKKNYYLHDHTLEHVPSAKYLGIIITSDLKWESHETNISQKANKTIGFLKRNLILLNSGKKNSRFVRQKKLYFNSCVVRKTFSERNKKP